MGRALALATVAVLIFVTVAFVMVQLFPPPLQPADYVVIGTIATGAALAVLFVVLLTTAHKGAGVFFRRRR